jgi:glycosyltransferase involved in cell wall biosynthesis
MTPDKPINVLYLVRTWAMGGGQTIVLLLLKHLDPARFNIIVVPYDAPGEGDAQFAKAVRAQGGEVAPERIPWRSRGNWRAAQQTIHDLVKKYDIDLIHTHDPQSNVLVGLNRRRFPCACVASPYGWWRRLFPLRSHVYVWLEKNVALPKFDRVLTVSRNMERKILQGATAPHRIRVIHTGLDLASLDGGAPREAAREDLGLPQDATVIGTVGRLYVEKGHSYFLDAAKVLAQDHEDAHFLIVGDGPLREPLQAQAKDLAIADRVIFTGYYDDLPGALRAMDLFVLPSILDEGFPTCLLEAQAAGLPVIATNRGGTGETMQESVTGVLVPPKNSAALAKAMADLVLHPERRRAMAQEAAAWIRSEFTLDTMVAGVTNAYDEALENHKNHANRH